MKIIKLKDDDLKCWECGKEYKRISYRENHENKFHPRPLIYETDNGYFFHGGIKISVHLGKDGNKKDPCYIAWENFEKQTGLKICVDINKDKLWLEDKNGKSSIL